MMRRTAVLGVLCAVLAAAPDAGSAPSPPNIIFIMSDDHRWDGLGAAGNPHVITPHLDRLAREACTFSRPRCTYRSAHPGALSC